MTRRLALAAVAVLAGCGAGGESPPGGLPKGMDPDSTAGAIMLRLHDMSRVGGRREAGGASGSFTAYLEDGRVLFIRERVTGAGGDTAENRYFFHDGRLFLFHGEGRVGGDDGDDVGLRLVYRDGRLAEAVKRVNGAEAPAPQGEIRAALAGLDAMVRQALRTSATSPARERERPEPVDLERDGSVRLTGRLAAGEHRDYAVQAAAGRVLEADLEVPKGAARFLVRLDRRNLGEGSPGRPWSRRLTGSGPYLVRVIASAGEESTDYVLELRLREP